MYLLRVLKRDEKDAVDYARTVEAFGRYLEPSYTGGDFTNLYSASYDNVLDYMDHCERGLKQKTSTVNRKVYILRKFFQYEVEHKRLDADPTNGVPLARKVATATKTLSLLEIEKLLATANSLPGKIGIRDAAMLHVLFLGVAKKEVHNLKLSDFNARAGTLAVGAGRKRRTLDLPEAAVRALEAYLRVRFDYEGNDALFVAKGGKAISGRQIWDRLRSIGKEAGIKVPTTSLVIRQSSAINKLMDDMAHLLDVKQGFGHSSLYSTEALASKALELKRKAAGMDGLIAGEVSAKFDATSRTRVLAAIEKYLSGKGTRSQRRDAVRDLGDVLEHYRDEAKALLGPDENDLFNILNNFDIRHHNETQKANYDPVWLAALFYHYLNMIHVLGSLMERRDGQTSFVA